ncbi:MAG: DUF1835 domain-containing protein [Alphaproteobacteria bacterium]|nr:DUF1835 domain-containing protein [Alphaproteobacteria bacterium]
MTELIITNGDSVAGTLCAAGFEADIVPWRDVLQEGPVPETPGAEDGELESLSAIRATFLADAFHQPRQEVVDAFELRDRTLRGHGAYDRITLWFEHDLYDQLQLLQILAFFHHEQRSGGLLLIQADDYLGWQSPDQIGRFEVLKAPVSIEQMSLAADLFAAFRKPTPIDLAARLASDLTPLPYMQQALRRLFEELPSATGGLSRTQHQALLLIERGEQPPKQLFGAMHAAEDAVFMGDLSFWRCLEELAFNTCPLISGLTERFHSFMTDQARRRYLDADMALTDAGHAVLSGQSDHAEINNIDRWLGGTHVTKGAIWRWDRDAEALIAPA